MKKPKKPTQPCSADADSDSDPADLNVEKIRALIDNWSSHGFFRVRELGSKILLDKVIARDAHVVDLKSQYEERSVSTKSSPYKEEKVDNKGSAPGMWEMEVRAPNDFEEREESMLIPHTEAVETCVDCKGTGGGPCVPCEGKGSVKCSFCNGVGTQICDRCQGTGQIRVTQTVTTHHVGNRPPGQPGFTTQSKRVSERCGCTMGRIRCRTCQGKRTKPCKTCSGKGVFVCPTCQGKRSLKTWKELSVKFRVAAAIELLNPTDVAPELIQSSSGETEFEDRAEQIGTINGVEKGVKDLALQLVGNAQETGSKESRLLFQHLHVKRVSTWEVAYRYKNSSQKRLWIYGNEGKIFAPKAPVAWKKVGILTGAVLLFVIIVIKVAV